MVIFMKTKKKFLSVLLLCVILCPVLSGCSNTTYFYDDFDKYTKGGATLETVIKNIEIDWISGDVKILKHAKNTIAFNETSNKKVNDDTSMYYYVEDDTLHIKFAKSGKFRFSNLEKSLTVELPESLLLDEVDINMVSADLTMDNINVKELDIDTVSGDIVTKSSAMEDFDIDSVSGSVNLITSTCPQKGKFNSVSGSICFELPQDAGYEVEFVTVSGDYNSDGFSTKKSGNTYTVGDGKAKYKVNTVSGDFSVRHKNMSLDYI